MKLLINICDRLIVLNTQKMCVGEGVGIILPLFKIPYGTKPITGLVLLLPPIHVLGQEELEKKTPFPPNQDCS